MRIRVLCFFLIFIPLAVFGVDGDEDVFTVAGIQFEISSGHYENETAFFDEVEKNIASACEAGYPPDMIVFPEYIGVFYQLTAFNDTISRHDNFQDALIDVLRSNPELGGMDDVFKAPAAWGHYLEGWSLLARKYNVFLVAGTCFVADDNGGLRNRAHVFGPDGNLVYFQDKVFLTEFETEIIGLTAGSLDDAGSFQVSGRDIALTICRDAYSPEWEAKNSGAFFWVDIKANGEVYDAAQQRSFLRALPSRLFYSDVNFGMTVCAVGKYLDLFWEGESSAIYKESGKLVAADFADSFNGPDIILINIAAGP